MRTTLYVVMNDGLFLLAEWHLSCVLQL